MMRSLVQVLRSAVAAVILAAWWGPAAPVAMGGEIDFYRDVYPILKVNCIACHNKTTNKAALSMETPEAMRKGGDSGEGVIPGNGAESLIYEAAAHTGGLEMPPKKNKIGAVDLKPDELALLKAWIDQGAKSSIKESRQVVWQALPPGVNPIYSVAMTRDGRLAACGRANQIFLYDLETRQLVTRLADESLDTPGTPQRTGAAHKALVQSLAFSPDGTRLASGSFREVKIWRREQTPAAIRKGDPALAAVISALSSDGMELVCADKQGTLHVLDAASGKVLKTIPTGIESGIVQLSLSPDAATAAVYGTDGSLSLWSLANGQRIARKEGIAGVRALAWTPDGKAIATGGEDAIVRLWPLPAEGQAELVVSKELNGVTGPITAIATAADRLIASRADGKVTLWNISEAKTLREFNVAGVVALDVTPDGKQLAAGRADGVVQLWDLETGTPKIELSGDAETHAHLALLNGEVAAEGLEMTFQKQEVARIEAENKAMEDRLKKADDSIATIRKELVEKQNAVTQAADAKAVAQNAADAAKTSPEAQQKEANDRLTAAVNAETAAISVFKAVEIHLNDAEVEARNFTAARTRNNEALATANAALAEAKESQDKATAELAATRNAASARKVQPLALRFSSDAETVAAVFDDGSLRVWAVASGSPIQHLSGVGATTAAALVNCADGAFAASAADGSTARVSIAWQWVLERTLGGTTADSPFVDRVNAVRFSPDGHTLAAGGGELTRSGDISLWDVASGAMVNEWKERHADAVLSLDFSPDGKKLASGGADKIARVTDVASGKLLNVFEGHTHHVLGTSFRGDGRVLATAGADGAVVVWDMISGERKKKIEGWSKEVTALQFIGATNQIVTSAGDNLIRIVDDNGGQVRAIPNLPDFMQSAASAATADVIIGGGEDGLLRVWNGTTGQELATFGADPSAKTP